MRRLPATMYWAERGKLHLHLDLPPLVVDAMSAYTRRRGQAVGELCGELFAEGLRDQLAGRRDPAALILREAEISTRLTVVGERTAGRSEVASSPGRARRRSGSGFSDAIRAKGGAGALPGGEPGWR